MASHTITNSLNSFSSKARLGFFDCRPQFSVVLRSFGRPRNRNLFPIRAMGSSASSPKRESAQVTGNVDYKSITDEEWRKRLTNDQFYITRQKGTERAFTGGGASFFCFTSSQDFELLVPHRNGNKTSGYIHPRIALYNREYWNTKTPGTYHCICCDTPLFRSDTKFDSGTGWPSYYQPIGNNVTSKLDLSIIFMPRQEVLCAACGAHLGHVFDDGPPPTGKRYCINSASLKLKPN